MSTELLAALPRGWATPPVYARFWVQLGKMLDEKRITGTHLAPYLRNVDVQWGHVNTVDLPEMDFSDEDRERYSLREGDLLVCEGGEVGRTSIWDGALAECYFQKAIHRLRPTTQNDEPRFFRYFMWMAVHSGIFAQTTASTIQHLTAEKLRVVRYPSPPIQRQRAIADYLDRETARLDELVAAKERVLGLLAEKRRALITRAVTRGLDPCAPLRDSGIPWLGEIPEHWDALRLKHLLKAQKGSIKTGPFGSQLHLSEMQEGQIKVYNQKTVIDRDIAGGEDYISKHKFDELRSFEVFPGDLLVTTRGTIGRCKVVPEQAERGILHPCLMRIQLAENRALNDYIEMLIEDSGQVLDQLRIVSNATTIDVIYSESLKEVWLAVPPIPEQRAIVAHVGVETTKLDALRGATERTIALLKERRAALIAAAVTGKLDVQGAEHHLDVVAD